MREEERRKDKLSLYRHCNINREFWCLDMELTRAVSKKIRFWRGELHSRFFSSSDTRLLVRARTHTRTHQSEHTVTNMVSHRDRQHYTFPYTKESLTRALNKINCILEWEKHNGYCLLSPDNHSLYSRILVRVFSNINWKGDLNRFRRGFRGDCLV